MESLSEMELGGPIKRCVGAVGANKFDARDMNSVYFNPTGLTKDVGERTSAHSRGGPSLTRGTYKSPCRR